MIRIGMIGTGYMAATHIKAFRQVPDARIVSLCNPSGRNLDGDFSKVMGNVGDADAVRLDMTTVKACRSLEELLADPEVDAVDICTPTKTHVPMALAALAAGKHVLVEKPLARTAGEASALLEAAAASSKIIMPAMCMRFWPGWSWLKEAVDTRRYGRVLSARFRRVAQAPSWGQGHFLSGGESGGALLDLHIHDVDFIQFLFGRPRSVYAQGHSMVSGAVDHVLAMFEFNEAKVVSAEGSWAMSPGFGFDMAFTLNFEKATVDFALARGADALRVIQDGQTTKPEIGPGDGYIGELKYFVDCIKSGTKPSAVTLMDAVQALEICAGEEESIRTGRPVAVFQSR
ncbi:MAG TPA: Gfo/Idh/MocA family oxidoreductase [Candidatus Limnocylindria bacterium]|jgi:predicted dehydrogenase|nr:Gfo/Idh/MocA family oxidoreductase [Candidatus Limnocylindria bacterium]